MTASLGLPQAAPLIALGEYPPPEGFVDVPETSTVRQWLLGGEAAPCLWVYGAPGSGRTALVASVLHVGADGTGGVKRVACHEGMSLEEALQEIADFLSHAGDAALARAMGQRTPLGAKIAVLLRSLAQLPAIVWIDGLDLLEEAMAECERGDEALRSLVDGAASLSRGAGRIIFTSVRPAPSAGFTSIALGDLPEESARSIWSRAGGAALDGSPLEDGIPRTPTAVRLAARIAASLAPEERRAFLEKIATPVPGDECRTIIDSALERIPREALEVLECAAVLGRPPTRQALRSVAAGAEDSSPREPAIEESASRDLATWGLALVAPALEREAPPLLIGRRTLRRVEELLRLADPDRWRKLQKGAVAYHLAMAGRPSGFWHHLAAWRQAQVAGLHEEAYAIQRTFLERLIERGFVDLARAILRATARTAKGAARTVALGNLSILYKNAGEHEKALETYEQVRGEFLAQGDLPNLARVLHQLGNTHYVRGNTEAALQSYVQSLELSSRLGEDSVAMATRIQIANIHYQRGENEEARLRYEESLVEIRKLEADPLLVAVSLQLSQVHLIAKRYLEAEVALEEAQAAAERCRDLRGLLKVFETQGKLARARREYDLARERYDRAARLARDLGDAATEAGILLLVGDLEKSRLQFVEALDCYFRARRCLGEPGAEASAGADGLKALGEGIDERVSLLAESTGPEGFERLLRRVCSERSPEATGTGSGTGSGTGAGTGEKPTAPRDESDGNDART